MSDFKNRKTFRVRLVRLLALNFFLAIPVALLLWWLENPGDQAMIVHHLVTSFIHSNIYGLTFGLIMPYAAERFSIVRSPWKWASIITCIVGIAFASTFFIQGVLFISGLLSPDKFWIEFIFKSITVVAIASIIAAIIGIYEKYREQVQLTNLQLRTQELETERALKLATEARLASLESRLHPHFLFNTLNSILALISEDPAQAEQMVQRLSSLLRKSLDAFSQSRVPLSEEIKLVTDYLEIEKVRFRERLSYSIEIPPGLDSFELPPLTLQPLVENCIKHSISIRPNGGEIRISATLNNDRLILSVWDDGPEFAKESAPVGHGLYSLQARLSAIAGEDASMDVQTPGIGKTVRVSLPVTSCKIA